jgi:hypothetical protein
MTRVRPRTTSRPAERDLGHVIAPMPRREKRYEQAVRHYREAWDGMMMRDDPEGPDSQGTVEHRAAGRPAMTSTERRQILKNG